MYYSIDGSFILNAHFFSQMFANAIPSASFARVYSSKTSRSTIDFVINVCVCVCTVCRWRVHNKLIAIFNGQNVKQNETNINYQSTYNFAPFSIIKSSTVYDSIMSKQTYEQSRAPQLQNKKEHKSLWHRIYEIILFMWRIELHPGFGRSLSGHNRHKNWNKSIFSPLCRHFLAFRFDFFLSCLKYSLHNISSRFR